MIFEDKYGILALLATRHPEERPIDQTDKGFLDSLSRNAGKKASESTVPAKTKPAS